MIPDTFAYASPTSMAEAFDLLARENTIILAGGQTLSTRLKHRRLRPDMVVDLRRLDLHDCDVADNILTVSALVPQARVQEVVRGGPFDFLARVGDQVGDPAIRAQGTLVGALCAHEPQGDWPAAALALDAELEIVSAEGSHRVEYGAWLGVGGTCAPGSFVRSVRIPRPPSDTSQSYHKVKHAAVGWCIAGAAIVTSDQHARIAVSGAVATPQRLQGLEAHLVSGEGDFRDVLQSDLEGLTFQGDHYASAGYRRKRLSVLLSRTLGLDHP